MDLEATLIEINNLISAITPSQHREIEIIAKNPYNPSNSPNQIEEILLLHETALKAIEKTLEKSLPTPAKELTNSQTSPNNPQKTNIDPFQNFTQEFETFYEPPILASFPYKENEKTLRSDTKPKKEVTIFFNSNKPKKHKELYPKNDYKAPKKPQWLKEMHSVDFHILEQIVLLSNEKETSPINLKKDPNYHNYH